MYNPIWNETGFDKIPTLLRPPKDLLFQATVGGTLLRERSKLFESHWSDQWLTSDIQLVTKSNRFGQAAVLPPEQLKQLCAELEQPYRIICEIAYFTAARVGEVVQLQAKDIQGEFPSGRLCQRIIYRAITTKTRTTKTATIPRQLMSIIAAADLHSTGYLFPSSGTKGHLTTRAVDKHLRRAADLLGFDGVGLHSFRRSQATHLHQAGVPLRAIQRITGHKSLSDLERYLDISGAEAAAQQQAALDSRWEVG